MKASASGLRSARSRRIDPKVSVRGFAYIALQSPLLDEQVQDPFLHVSDRFDVNFVALLQLGDEAELTLQCGDQLPESQGIEAEIEDQKRCSLDLIAAKRSQRGDHRPHPFARLPFVHAGAPAARELLVPTISTVPASPSIRTTSPSRRIAVTPGTPTTVAIPNSRARIAECERVEPRSTINPRAVGKRGAQPGSVRIVQMICPLTESSSRPSAITCTGPSTTPAQQAIPRSSSPPPSTGSGRSSSAGVVRYGLPWNSSRCGRSSRAYRAYSDFRSATTAASWHDTARPSRNPSTSSADR